ncbi:amidase [Burkholderia sp. Ac-20379]|nr:amidase [Burkholderia sp. Ac-20379]
MEVNTAEFDLTTITIDAIQSGLLKGRFTAEALTRASLAWIARLDGTYNAMVCMNPAALDEARRIDRLRETGARLPPLAGVPVAVKDTMDVAGLPTTAGWWKLHGPLGGTALVPSRDATVVERIRAAGAVILGKTNVPILGCSGSHANNSWAGPTLNAAMPDRVPGASSTGSATAVACGMAVVGLAAETGGSIQNPASAQGLVGIKPTVGLVPATGTFPLSSLRDVIGPIARTVRDAARCLDVLAGYGGDDPNTSAALGHDPGAGGYTAALCPDALAGARLGLYGPGWRPQPLSGEAAALYANAQAELVRLGATLAEDPFAGSGFAALRQPTPPTLNFDARGLESLAHDLDRYFSRYGPGAPIRGFDDFVRLAADPAWFAPDGLLRFMPHLPAFGWTSEAAASAPDMSAFLAVQARYTACLNRVFDAHRLDALVFPQMRSELPGLHAGRPIEETTVDEINIGGFPAVTIPAGRYASGAPFGLIFVGRHWSEAGLLALAHAYECGSGSGRRGFAVADAP